MVQLLVPVPLVAVVVQARVDRIPGKEVQIQVG
jgi:hypothetical protein